MHPVLLHLPGGSPVYGYGTMLALSFFVGWELTLWLCRRDGLDPATMRRCFVVTALSALLAARGLFVLTNPALFANLLDAFDPRQGGLVAYGGFLGGLLGSLVFCRLRSVPLLPWADCAAPALCTGLLLTRVGCLLAGCDFGLPWGGPWALSFPAGSPAFREQVAAGLLPAAAVASLPVHPTQLYESLTGLALLGLVLWVRRVRRRPGEALAAFGVGYALLRFYIETLRGDPQRGGLGALSTSQVLALLTLVAGLGLLAWLRKHGLLPETPQRATLRVQRH